MNNLTTACAAGFAAALVSILPCAAAPGNGNGGGWMNAHHGAGPFGSPGAGPFGSPGAAQAQAYQNPGNGNAYGQSGRAYSGAPGNAYAYGQQFGGAPSFSNAAVLNVNPGQVVPHGFAYGIGNGAVLNMPQVLLTNQSNGYFHKMQLAEHPAHPDPCRLDRGLGDQKNGKDVGNDEKTHPPASCCKTDRIPRQRPAHPPHPDHPDHPEHPDHPDHPDHPEHPDHPPHPIHPAHPVHPYPDHPLHPIHPEHPAHSVHPEHPVRGIHPSRPLHPLHPTRTLKANPAGPLFGLASISAGSSGQFAPPVVQDVPLLSQAAEQSSFEISTISAANNACSAVVLDKLSRTYLQSAASMVGRQTLPDAFETTWLCNCRAQYVARYTPQPVQQTGIATKPPFLPISFTPNLVPRKPADTASFIKEGNRYLLERGSLLIQADAFTEVHSPDASLNIQKGSIVLVEYDGAVTRIFDLSDSKSGSVVVKFGANQSIALHPAQELAILHGTGVGDKLFADGVGRRNIALVQRTDTTTVLADEFAIIEALRHKSALASIRNPQGANKSLRDRLIKTAAAVAVMRGTM